MIWKKMKEKIKIIIEHYSKIQLLKYYIVKYKIELENKSFDDIKSKDFKEREVFSKRIHLRGIF